MRRFVIFGYIVAGVIFIGSGLLIKFNMPIGLPTVSSISLPTGLNKANNAPLNFKWPNGVQSSVGVYGHSEQLNSSSHQKPAPTASTAKLITALVVLDKYPLNPGQQGPILTISPTDAALYHDYVSRDGTTTRVVAGEKISQYQMLQAMMLPSSNNAADSLAIWAFGSLVDYKKAAQVFLKEHKLDQTTIGSDASGLDAGTTSTASDLAKIAKLTLDNLVLRQIVTQKTAIIPVAGEVKNTNKLLGQDGFLGIKTGHTDESGGVYVFASEYRLDGLKSPIIIYGAIQGAPTIADALENARVLVSSVKKTLKVVSVVSVNQNIAQLSTDWGGKYDAVAKDTVAVVNFPGGMHTPKLEFDTLVLPIKANSQVGRLTIGDKSTPLVVTHDIDLPSTLELLFGR